MAGGPAGLVDLAAEQGLRSVCLFAQGLDGADSAPLFPVVTGSELPALKRRITDAGISVTNVEYFPILPAKTSPNTPPRSTSRRSWARGGS